jgi:hypothetical protein
MAATNWAHTLWAGSPVSDSLPLRPQGKDR